MMALSYIIDPGGDVYRPGINLQVFPDGQSPLEQSGIGVRTERLASTELAASNYDYRYEFEFNCTLPIADFGKLEGLLKLLQNSANNLGQWELVIYNLAEPFTEISPTRTRYKVPGTSVILQEDLGDGFYYWQYWVALQGSLNIVEKQRFGSHIKTTLSFVEGTFLGADLE